MKSLPYLRDLLFGVVCLMLLLSCSEGGSGDEGDADQGIRLTVHVNGGGAVVCEPDVDRYAEGETVEISPSADPGYIFSGWSGDADGDQSPLILVLSHDCTLTANFAVDGTYDSDDDGILNADEDVNRNGIYSDDDTDGDGTPNYLDVDDDGDGINTADEDGDADGDTLPDYLECNYTDLESPADGLCNNNDSDDDGDGLSTSAEDVNGNGWPADDDTDGDGVINAYDNDDDGDGVITAIESGADSDGDGVPDHLEPSNLDPDLDGTYNQNDPDDDGDGIDTVDEDLNDNGNYFDDDADGDNIPAFLDPDDHL